MARFGMINLMYGKILLDKVWLKYTKIRYGRVGWGVVNIWNEMVRIKYGKTRHDKLMYGKIL